MAVALWRGEWLAFVVFCFNSVLQFPIVTKFNIWFQGLYVKFHCGIGDLGVVLSGVMCYLLVHFAS